MKISYRCEICNDEKRYPTFGEVASHIATEHSQPLEDVTIVSVDLNYVDGLAKSSRTSPEILEEK